MIITQESVYIFKMKIDLHVHSGERSFSCCETGEEEQIKTAIKKGLDALVFTDHDLLVSKDRLKELNDKYAPFRIFGGIEVRIRGAGYDEDFLVIGVYEPKLEKGGKWLYEELYKIVEDNEGYLAIAHPYRYSDEVIDVGNFPPHAIELYSSNINDEKSDKRIKLANEWDCQLITNSDSHIVDTIGSYYNELFDIPKDEKDLIKILKEGRYKTSKS